MVGASARYSDLYIPVETVTPPSCHVFCGKHNAAWRRGNFRAGTMFPPDAPFFLEQGRDDLKYVFHGDMCVGKNTAQPANVRAQRVRCSGLYLKRKPSEAGSV